MILASWLRWLCAGVLGFLLTFPAWGEVPVPDLSQRVTDLTNTLSASAVQQLDNKLADLEARKGSQIAVLLIPTLDGEDIASFGIRVADKWKIGRKGVDDGAILIIAKNDRKLRIEVGYGLEGVIPDAIAKRIIDETIVPKFRAGDFDGGVIAGVDQMIGLVNGEALPPPSASKANDFSMDDLTVAVIGGIVGGAILSLMFGRGTGGFVAGLGAGAYIWSVAGLLALAGGIFIFVWLIVLGMGRGGGSGWSSGGWGGGGFGGGGWSGGGGFSGGGGGFGGGGSSGSW